VLKVLKVLLITIFQLNKTIPTIFIAFFASHSPESRGKLCPVDR